MSTPVFQRFDLGDYTLVIDPSVDPAAVADDVLAGPCRLVAAVITNTDAGEDCFFRVYNHKDPVIGTTPPALSFKVEPQDSRPLFFGDGISFSYGLSFTCVNNGGGTAGATAVTAKPIAVLLLKEGVS